MSTSPFRPFSFTKTLVTLVFLLVFVGVLGFAWRIFAYYRQVQTDGALVFSSYNATQATVDTLVALVGDAQPSGSVATQDDPVLAGSADAPITLVAFVDFGCPYSQEESLVFSALARQFPEELRIIIRDFPLIDLHPGADLAAMASECAAEQGKYSEMYTVLNTFSQAFTSENLLAAAQSIGLLEYEYEDCMRSGYYEDELAQDIADGVALGVTSTPTLFLNGVKIEGAVPYAILYATLSALVL